MRTRILKKNLKRFKQYFPESIQQIGTQVWNDIELPLASVIERRSLLKAQHVVWPNAEVADFEHQGILGPTPDDVLIDVVFTLVSPGTERAQYLSLPGSIKLDKFSMYHPGYSGSGVVTQMGRRITRFTPGDRVAGRIQHSSLAVVAEPFIFHIPPTVILEDAAFVELGIIAQQGVRKARIKPGESVVVIGQGLIGQLANRLCRAAGAAPIVAVARTRSKAQTALANGGADEFATVDEITDQFDIVIEATGDVNIIPFATSLAHDGGRVIGLGTPRGTGPFNLGQLDNRANITISGAHITGMPHAEQTTGLWTYRSEGELFLDLLAQQRIFVSDLVTQRLDPCAASEFYESLVANSSHVIGALFDWREMPPAL